VWRRSLEIRTDPHYRPAACAILAKTCEKRRDHIVGETKPENRRGV